MNTKQQTVYRLIHESLAAGNIPRLHGNGFAQLDLVGYGRLHIWPDPLIPAQEVQSPIHNHTYSFISEVIVGTMHSFGFHIELDSSTNTELPTHSLYQAVVRHDEDTVLEPIGLSAVFRSEGATLGAVAGGYYEHPAKLFHESRPEGFTVTLMRKTGEFGGVPIIAVPYEFEPDSTFDRYSKESKVKAQMLLTQVIAALEGALISGNNNFIE